MCQLSPRKNTIPSGSLPVRLSPVIFKFSRSTIDAVLSDLLTISSFLVFFEDHASLNVTELNVIKYKMIRVVALRAMMFLPFIS